MQTVGQFTLDADGILSGPNDYMTEQGNAKLDRILSGDDTVFNACASYSPTLETAVLVAMQTDYAGWKGTRDLLRQVAAPPAPQEPVSAQDEADTLYARAAYCRRRAETTAVDGNTEISTEYWADAAEFARQANALVRQSAPREGFAVEPDYGGAWDGFRVTSDADPGL